MKKLAACGFVAVVLSGFGFAKDFNVSFENKISSDVVSIKDSDADFAGIKEHVTAEIESERVDAGVSFITVFKENDESELNFTEYEFDKAYIEFRPVDFLSIDFRRKVFTPGSYLPIIDDNVGNGNIASDFALLYRPIENLSLAGGMNIPSVFAHNETSQADFNVGFKYETEKFSVGAALRSPINDIKFGVFGSYTGIEGLSLNFGFSYDDEFADIKGDLITFGSVFKKSIFTVQFDFVTNFAKEGQDLYTALNLETGINENWAIETQGTLKMDYDDSNETHVIPEVAAIYKIGNHKFKAGFAVDIYDNNAGLSFPVYYKYSF